MVKKIFYVEESDGLNVFYFGDVEEGEDIKEGIMRGKFERIVSGQRKREIEQMLIEEEKLMVEEREVYNSYEGAVKLAKGREAVNYKKLILALEKRLMKMRMDVHGMVCDENFEVDKFARVERYLNDILTDVRGR